MEFTRIFTNKGGEIIFSDLDSDNEMEIITVDNYGETTTFYLSKENLLGLKEHIDYLLTKQ